MTAGIYNFKIEQGARLDRTFTWKDSLGNPVDLTGYDARMKIKDLSGSVLISLATAPNTNGDRLTLGGTLGTIVLYISATTTLGLNFERAKYDLKMIPPDTQPVRLIQGAVDYSIEVTD